MSEKSNSGSKNRDHMEHRSKQTPDLSRTGGCVGCSRPDSYDNFVQCDHCDGWWHMRCAGVTDSIAERPWTCRNCLPQSVLSMNSSKSARVALRLKLLEEERAIQQRELEAEMKALQLERKAIREKYKLLEEQLAEEEDNESHHSRISRRASMQRVNLWVEEQKEKDIISGSAAAVVDKSDLHHPTDSSQLSTNGQGTASRQKMKAVEQSATNQDSVARMAGLYPSNVRHHTEDIQQRSNGEFPKEVSYYRANPYFPSIPPILPPGKPPIRNNTFSAQPCEDPYNKMKRVESMNLTQEGHSFLSSVHFPTVLGRNETRFTPRAVTQPNVNLSQENVSPPFATISTSEQAPTPAQLAARQIMPRDLPPFAGDPADWPIFISAFANTTTACGYSYVENLARLQRCLKGAAYEAVRSRLLLPELVPQVISTLQLLYGRPELLINVLLDKVRSTPTPKAEKLETLIEFGMAVQGLCDHLQAAGLQSHLTNPYLLIELVEKLPAHVKMEWAHVMQQNPEANLKTFGDFMNGVVISASRVTLYTGGCSKSGPLEKTKIKGRGSINAHVSQPETTNAEERRCYVCKSVGHRVRECQTFKALSVDNRWKTVQSHELCRSCLNAHGRRSCRNAKPCGINACIFRHHPLLHGNRSNQTSGEKVSQNIESAGNHTHRSANQSLLFRILPVTLYGPRKVIKTFAFLDDGSQLTLVEEQLAKELGVSGSSVPLCLTWTGDVSRTEPDSKQLQLVVSSADEGKRLKVNDVRTVKKLALPEQTLRIGDLKHDFQYLKGLPIAEYKNATPRLLIGINNLHLSVPLKMKEGRANEPVAMKTRLGWCVYGGSGDTSTTSLNYHVCGCNSNRNLHDLVKDYFTQEDVGTKPAIELVSAEDRRAQLILQQTTVRSGERYETGLLWKHDVVEFPESYRMALRRLECLERRMARNPFLKENLNRQIAEYQQKGYAHQVTDEELKAADLKRVWYLPLGAVVNPKKPEKVRLIWDAAAAVNGISLNSMLLKGPDQLAPLTGVLSRFRQFAVALSADIKEMFHQIRIREADRHSQRFLWRDDPANPPNIFVMDVAIFGSTCSPASAQYVKNRNAAEFANDFPKAVEDIVNNTYVDDYLSSYGTEAEAEEAAAQVKAIQLKGGFLLRNWQSNRANVIQNLGEPSETSHKHVFMDKTKEYERVLGMLWLTDEDALSFCTRLKDDVQQIIGSDSRPTKRQVLRCLMSYFDPLGLLSHLLVHGKILLQDVWRTGIQWDEEVNETYWERWRRWTALLQRISDIKIPRCYFSEATIEHYSQLQLHVFVDASEAAYAAVAYFRIIGTDGTPRCTLVAAKNKVAPLKPLTIPRLELQAAVLGVRLMRFILESHTVPVTERYLWSDSSTVLGWLRADPRKYSQYVACRVGEILTATDVNDWRWVPSKLNPADLATKWGAGPSLDAEGIWFKGPPFLLLSVDEWPKKRVPQQTVEEELRACYVHCEVSPSIIDCGRFSKWERLHRATAYVYRYVFNLKQKVHGSVTNIGHLTQDELRKAEVILVRLAQQQAYSVELAVLSHNRTLSQAEQNVLDKSSPLYRLTPLIDEANILRVDGRIGAAKNWKHITESSCMLIRKQW